MRIFYISKCNQVSIRKARALLKKGKYMFILLFLFWIALNGSITGEIIILGLAVAGFVYWLMCKFFDYSPKSDILFLKKYD